MGNESSASHSSSSIEEDEEEETETVQEAPTNVQNDNPVVSTKQPTSHRDQNFKFYACAAFKMQLFAQNFQHVNDFKLPSFITYLCGLYLDDEQTDRFDASNKGLRSSLNHTNNQCVLSEDVANTIYGTFKVDISKFPSVTAYRWRFKVLHKKQNIYIGIDSNPSFSHTDYSNCFRDFKFTNFAKRDDTDRDRFCAYSSDGFLFHYHSQVAHPFGTKWKIGDEITMLVDVKQDALRYYVNEADQGVAMDKLLLSKKTYHIAVALFYEGDSVELLDFSVSSN